MPMDNQARIELLKKAREAKAAKAKLAKDIKLAEAQKQAMKVATNDDLKELLDDEVVEEVIEVKKKPKARKTAVAEPKTLNLTLPEANNDVNEVEETIKIKAPKKKKVIRRVIEVEESDTEEEIVEEIKRIPKGEKEVRISRKEMMSKLVEQNRQVMMNQLFP